MTAFQEFQQKMQQQVLAMWPDKLPPQLAGKSREDLERLMQEVAKLSTLLDRDLPANLSPLHRFFLDFGRTRYRDLLQMGTMLLKVRGAASDAEFKSWLEKHIPAGNRDEAELAMRAVREAR